jgi:transposase
MVGAPHNSKRRQTEAIELMSPPNNYSSRQAGRALKVPYRTLSRWFRHFQLFGETPAITANRNSRFGCLRKKYRRLVTPQVIACLRILVHQTPWMFLDEFRDSIFLQTGIFLRCSTIYRLLKKQGWSLKKIFADALERCASF